MTKHLITRDKMCVRHNLFLMFFLVFCLFVFYSFVTIPFSGDVQVFMAAANQVKYQDGNIFMSIFQAWELKGIANRALMWLLYFLSDTLVGYDNKILFECAVKIIYAIITIIILAISAYIWPVKDKQKRIYVFFVMYFTVFATYTAVQLQAEMTCVILSLFCTACILHGDNKSLVIGGITASFLMFFKSIFILLFAVILVGTIVCDDDFYNKKKNYLLTTGTMVVSEIIWVCLIKIIYPQEFKDMGASAEFQSTLFSRGSSVSLETIFNNFTNYFTQSAVSIPFLLIGVISAIYLILQWMREKDHVRIASMIIMWLLPIDLIVVSNMYFQYHYYLLMLPGMISIITLLKNIKIENNVFVGSGIFALLITMACWYLKDGLNQIGIINYSTVLLVIIHIIILAFIFATVSDLAQLQGIFYFLLMTICLFFWLNYSSAVAPKYRNLVWLHKNSFEICEDIFPEDFGGEPVLFLDAGNASFYKDAPSYSRYFYNLPMQRWQAGDSWEVQESEYKKLMEYNGKYIIMHNGWFGLDKYPELKKKFEEEYKKIPNSGLFLHSPDWNAFSLSGIPEKQSINADTGICILERK